MKLKDLKLRESTEESCDAMRQAIEQSKISKKNMEDVLDERTPDEVEDTTAIKDSDLTKGVEKVENNMQPITESVADRKSLSKLLARLNKEGIKPTIKKSVVEGMRYDVTYTAKKLDESLAGDEIVDELVDRARGWLADGSSIEDAVAQAIDDGLIYTDDIFELAKHYYAYDSREIVDRIYDELYSDIYNELKNEQVGKDDANDDLKWLEDGDYHAQTKEEEELLRKYLPKGWYGRKEYNDAIASMRAEAKDPETKKLLTYYLSFDELLNELSQDEIDDLQKYYKEEHGERNESFNRGLKEDFVERYGELSLSDDDASDDRYVIIEGGRDGYGIDQVEGYTMTVEELIDKLAQYRGDTKVVLGNDWNRYGFYTYGYIDGERIHEVIREEKDDDDEDDEDEYDVDESAKSTKSSKKRIKESSDLTYVATPISGDDYKTFATLDKALDFAKTAESSNYQLWSVPKKEFASLKKRGGSIKFAFNRLHQAKKTDRV